MSIASNIEFIKTNLPSNCQLIAVSKNRDIQQIQQALNANQVIFGENKVQEAASKFSNLQANYKLHLIGGLQTNKVTQALSVFDVIQTIDREKLAKQISKELNKRHNNIKTKEFYIQINIGEEPQKNGIMPNEAANFISYCKNDLHLNITGVMCIPPANNTDDSFLYFALTRNFAKKYSLPNISMGMSNDWELAIKLGATHIRIGRGIFD